jgi:hypothetical protein
MFRDLQEGLVKRDREINNGKRSDKLSVEEFVETVIKKCPTKKSEDISALKRALAFEVSHHTLPLCTRYNVYYVWYAMQCILCTVY